MKKHLTYLSLVGFLLSTLVAAGSAFTESEVASSFVPKEVDQLPEATTQVAPDLPKKLQGIRAFVRVAVLVNEEGKVVTAHIAKSSAEELNDATLEAVRAWRYKPALKDGVPVATRFVVPFRYK